MSGTGTLTGRYREAGSEHGRPRVQYEMRRDDTGEIVWVNLLPAQTRMVKVTLPEEP